MPEVYARKLRIFPLAQDDLETRLLNALREWVGQRWPEDQPWFSCGVPRRFLVDNGSIFRWEPFVGGGESLFEFTWRHPDATDEEITWATQVSVVSTEDDVYLSLRVWNTGPETRERGLLLTTRPRLLRHLCDQFELRLDGMRLSSAPRPLPKVDVLTFVRYELLDPERTVPILLISPGQDGSWSVLPDRLTDEFLSLAEPVVIEDPSVTFDLTRELGGKALSCFGGAARLYLPTFSKGDSPLRHPLLLPRRLRDAGVRSAFAQALARMTVESYTPLRHVQRLRDLRAVAYDRGHESLAASLEAAQKRGAAATEWQALAEEYADDNERLRAEIAGLRESVSDTDQRIRALQYQLRQAHQAKAPVPPEEAIDFAPESVLAAVEFAQAAFDDDILILDSAIDAAADSVYVDPSSIFDALRDMADLAKRMREGPLGKNLKDAFAERGWSYRAGISESSSKVIRDQHHFRTPEGECTCEEHLIFGTSFDPARCARIYFNSGGDSSGRFIVGHVGRHLDTPRTN